MNTPPCDMLVLGGTGDLSLHKLLPALYHLHREGRLPGDMRIHTAALDSLSRDAYLALAERNCRAQVARSEFDNDTWQGFAARIDYFSMDLSQSADFNRLGKWLGDGCQRGRVYYLATAPDLFEPIAEHLHNAGLAGPHFGGGVEVGEVGAERLDHQRAGDQSSHEYGDDDVHAALSGRVHGVPPGLRVASRFMRMAIARRVRRRRRRGIR